LDGIREQYQTYNLVKAVSRLTSRDGSQTTMNVCMIAYTFYENDNRVMRYAETLAARGDHVDIIALRKVPNERGEVVNGVNVIKVQTRVHDEKGQMDYLFRLLTFFVRASWVLWWRHRRIKYDLIHVHSVPDFLVFTALLPRLTGAKVILDIHDILPELYASKFGVTRGSLTFKVMLLIERLSASAADHVIIANDLWRNRIIARSVAADKCTVIMNYPDRNIFRRSGRTRGDDGRFVILYPGTLNWHQGLDIAIHAMAMIKDRLPETELHIYGVGPERKRLAALIEELHLKDRVTLFLPVRLCDVCHIMENADLGVIPKRADSFATEAFSTKTLEFMIMGVPMILSATDIDTLYFQERQVMFFPPGDVEALAEAIAKLVRDPEMRKDLALRGERFVATHDWQHKKDLYLDLVNSLVSNPGQPVTEFQ
jgi:glycosyltransferase involved in cell wall biosynthesis